MTEKNKIVGFVAGTFDVIHPGYIYMFDEMRRHCNYVMVGLHEDPSLERANKLKPVLTVEERRKILLSLRHVNAVVVYKTEKGLYNVLKHVDIDIRFLGSDYKNKDYTGKDLDLPIWFTDRDHGWSTTKFKKLISESL